MNARILDFRPLYELTPEEAAKRVVEYDDHRCKLPTIVENMVMPWPLDPATDEATPQEVWANYKRRRRAAQRHQKRRQRIRELQPEKQVWYWRSVTTSSDFPARRAAIGVDVAESRVTTARSS